MRKLRARAAKAAANSADIPPAIPSSPPAHHSKTELTLDQQAAVIRQMIRHEDSVLNKRLSWCVTIEGLLLAALAFAWDRAQLLFVLFLCLAGIGISVITVYASRKTIGAMNKLTGWFTTRFPGYDGPSVIGLAANEWNNLLRPSRGIPYVFGLLWVAVLSLRLVCLYFPKICQAYPLLRQPVLP